MKQSFILAPCIVLALGGVSAAQTVIGGSTMTATVQTTVSHDGDGAFTGGDRDGDRGGFFRFGDRDEGDRDRWSITDRDRDGDHDRFFRDRDHDGDRFGHDHDGAFDRLSPGNQKIARDLFRAQNRGAGEHRLTLNQIAAMKSHDGWGQIFHQMKANGQIDARNLGQVVSGHYQVSTVHHHDPVVTLGNNHSTVAGSGRTHGGYGTHRGGDGSGSASHGATSATGHWGARSTGHGGSTIATGGHWHGGAASTTVVSAAGSEAGTAGASASAISSGGHGSDGGHGKGH